MPAGESVTLLWAPMQGLSSEDALALLFDDGDDGGGGGDDGLAIALPGRRGAGAARGRRGGAAGRGRGRGRCAPGRSCGACQWQLGHCV